MLKTSKEFTFEGKKYIQVHRVESIKNIGYVCQGCIGYIDEAQDKSFAAKLCDEANKHDDCLENDLSLIWVKD